MVTNSVSSVFFFIQIMRGDDEDNDFFGFWANRVGYEDYTTRILAWQILQPWRGRLSSTSISFADLSQIGRASCRERV